jgi:uncharacterized protein YdhG (YjbR/CyaY superfamily)
MKKKTDVQAYMDHLEHPFKTEVEVMREIIKGVNKDIQEEIKWNAPSYSYKGSYLVTFNLHATKHIHLVFHNPHIAKIHNDLLEGDYRDRRMAYFKDMKDVETKKGMLEIVLRELISLNEP